MLLGLRGTGKTVLLNEIGRIANNQGFFVSKIEAPEHQTLARLLYPEMRKILRSLSTIEVAKQLAMRGLKALRGFASIFKIEVVGAEIAIEPEPGLADSGDLQFDLPDLFTTIGKAAQAGSKGAIFVGTRSVGTYCSNSQSVTRRLARDYGWSRASTNRPSGRRGEIIL
jgi:hypothetical protein